MYFFLNEYLTGIVFRCHLDVKCSDPTFISNYNLYYKVKIIQSRIEAYHNYKIMIFHIKLLGQHTSDSNIKEVVFDYITPSLYYNYF